MLDAPVVHHHAHHAPAHHARMRRAVASWYGPGLYGSPVACTGHPLTPATLGVAHKTLRCGARVRLCYRRCRTLRVIDRGPFVAGRDFDLTAAARTAVGHPGGVRVVRFRVIG